jgi:gliding motility-associated-like protein
MRHIVPLTARHSRYMPWHAVLVVMGLLSAPLLVQADAVVSVTPAVNAQQVAIASNIIVVFDVAIDPTNLSMATFRVSGELTGIITGSFTGGGTRTITFNPAQDFRAGELITVTLTTDLGLTTAYIWQFRVASAPVTANFVTRAPLTTSADIAYSVHAADVDGDGDLDVLSASAGDDEIAWYENDGNENFTVHTITTAADYANSVYAADMDGDGDLDVLSASGNDDKIAWYENDGDENFTVHTITTAADYANCVYAADIDGDGDLDVLSASGMDDKIAWYENDGLENFTPHTITTTGDGAVSVYATDMDSDGDLDVLSAWNNKITWYENDGSASFTEHPIIGNGAVSAYVADIDNDGDMDVLGTSATGRITWYENDGSQSFGDHLIMNSPNLVYDVGIADLDGDGDMDVLVGGAGLTGISWQENDGSENFTYHALTTAALGVFSVYPADMDGDGDLDVLSASFSDDKIAWYTNNLPPVIAGTLTDQRIHVSATESPFATLALSDRDAGQALTVSVQLDDAAKGSFTPASLTTAGFTAAGSGNYTFIGTASDAQAALRLLIFEPATGRLALGASETVGFTLEADDHVSPATTDNTSLITVTAAIEAISVTPADNAQQVSAASDITVVFNDVIPSPDVSIATFRVKGEHTGMIAGSFTGGGTNTIIFNPTQDFKAGEVITVTLTPGLGMTRARSWQFTVASALVTANFVTIVPISIAADRVQSVYAADVDGDGDMDALSASFGDNKIAWYENDGSENFASHTITTSAAGAISVYAADVDGDGDLDVLSSSGNDDKIAWYENDGAESFTPHTITTTADYAISVYAADMDGDGDLDVLSASQYDNKIAWYENDGSENFVPHTITTGAAVATSVYATDVDGDGDMDVLSASNSSYKIAWYENDGSGNFADHTVTTSVVGATSVYAADVDGDSDMDVLSASGDNKIAWYENDNGSQNFIPHIITAIADKAYAVYAADVDGDGDTDVLSASLFDNKIAWYENDGSQNFANHTITIAANRAVSVFTADMDGDGDLDVLSASVNDDKIAWYPNNLPPAVDGTLASQPVADNATARPFSATILSDRDAGQILTVNVQLDDAAKGSFTTASLTAAGFTDAGTGNYVFSGTAQAANVALQQLVFAPASDRVTGISEIVGLTITADDHVSPATTDNITSVVVSAVNDAPFFTKGANITVDEDAAAQSVAGWATNLSAGPSNESGQSLNFQVSNDNNTLFIVQPAISASGTLTFTPAANVWGEAIVTVVLQDNGGTANGGENESAATTFTITLNPVNDVPSFTKGADIGGNEDDATQSVGGWATNLSAGPSNESGQSLSFQVTNDNNALFSVQPDIDASGALTFTPAADAWGSATVTVIITDDGGTANGGVDISAAITFTLTLNAVNDAPSFTKGVDVAGNENAAAQSLVGWATNLSTGPANESGQSLNFQVSNDNNTLFSAQPAIDASGTLTFTPASDAWGEVTVTVVLQDDGGAANGGVDESAAATFSLSILPSNKAPGFTKGADVAVNEDSEAQTLVAWATNLSAGPSRESSQSLNFQVSNDNNTLFSAQPAIDASGTLTFTPTPDAWGRAIVTAVLQDDGGTANGGIDLSATVTFIITLNAVNDAPVVDPVNDVMATVNSEPFTVTLTGLNSGPGEASQQLTVVASSNTHSLLADPVVTMLGDGTATLQLVPIQGMIDMATITVVIRDNGGTALGGQDETMITFTLTISDAVQSAFIPTLFSPNDDGANDVFRVRASGIADIRFSVFSADGHEVFHTTDVIIATENGWNGSYQGRDMPAGVYTWTLQGHYRDGSALTIGNKPHGQVVLLR